jgi:polyhydroxyalkanoate synthesis regulator phasin
MVVRDTLEKLVLLQIGAAAITQERVERAVSQLIEQGRMTREEGRSVAQEVMDRARQRSTSARTLIDASMQQGMRQVGVPTRQDYEDLLFRVEQLEHRIRLLEDQAARPPAPPPSEGDSPETPSP